MCKKRTLRKCPSEKTEGTYQRFIGADLRQLFKMRKTEKRKGDNHLESKKSSKRFQSWSVLMLKPEAHYQEMKVQRGLCCVLDKQEHMPTLRNVSNVL